MTTEAEAGAMWLAPRGAEEAGRAAAAGRGKEGFHAASQRSTALPTPCFQPSGPQDCETITFWRFGPAVL